MHNPAPLPPARTLDRSSAFLAILSVTLYGCGTESRGAVDPDGSFTIASVVVTPDTLTFEALGQEAQLTAVAYDAAGNELVDQTFDWSSSDAVVAGVTDEGIVTAVGNGAARISAAVSGVSGATSLTVSQAAASLAMAPPSTTILFPAGETVKLTATATDANGHEVSGKPLVWESSDETVATVDGAGLVVAVGEGTVAIKVSIDDLDATTTIRVGYDCFPNLATPVLALKGTEAAVVNGVAFTRYRLTVTNPGDIPDQIFLQAPDLPPCGLNTRSSRTWVNIRHGNGRYIYGFCALGRSSNLDGIWFGVGAGTAPPASVYIELHDRRCNLTYRSNAITV